jgi:hypothetical protein
LSIESIGYGRRIQRREHLRPRAGILPFSMPGVLHLHSPDVRPAVFVDADKDNPLDELP